jgi:DNA-binding NarL/FixJ family response regulator
MREPVRVLLVDDHAMMRAGFRMVLEATDDIVVVGEASTGAEAVEAVRTLRPDVVCMDVQMPDMDGLEATRRITAETGDTAVLIVTTFDRDDYLFAALSAGAAGFLLKNAGPEELARAVRVAAAGDALLAPEVTRRVIARFTAGAEPVERGGTATATDHPDPAVAPRRAQRGVGTTTDADAFRFASSARAQAPVPAEPFTDREAEVLRLLADALSNAEIAQRLFIGEATVKTHVSNVLAKLGARDRVQAVVLAYRHGLA